MKTKLYRVQFLEDKKESLIKAENKKEVRKYIRNNKYQLYKILSEVFQYQEEKRNIDLEWFHNKDITTSSGPCQLITAINALKYYGKSLPTQEEIEELIDLSGCRYGAVIHRSKMLTKLGLKEIHFARINDFKRWLKMGFVVDLAVHSPDWGYHSVLVVAFDEGKGFLVTNWEHEKLTSWVKELKIEHASVLIPL